MLFSLLADATENNNSSTWSTYIFLGIVLVVLVVGFVLTSRKSKKREEEQKNMLDAIKPGDRVTTIGGISGVVVEVNKEENTFVLETGSADSDKKSYLKFLKQAVYQTDTKLPDGDEENTANEETSSETESVTDNEASEKAEETKENE